jgi:hypothetical protein
MSVLSSHEESIDSLFTGWWWNRKFKCRLRWSASCTQCDPTGYLSSEYVDVQVWVSEGESEMQFINSSSQRPIP